LTHHTIPHYVSEFFISAATWVITDINLKNPP
jgi:hypothetical protein